MRFTNSLLKKVLAKRWKKEVVLKTASATPVSMTTAERIKAEAKKSPGGVICSPSARPSPVVGQLDYFDRECIRRELLSFYERGELPTLSTLLERVKQPVLKGHRVHFIK
ncbi:hypothetical protein Hamer_G030492 [Homarus americanus]|uniref:Uncharacterized protein n=1 Tax=Homarus americanus TaxID=6706 RepID=A0A8J5K6U3_HOMAM|nr:hypothetical protein Hamer_G030492 [Homarus americanus]